MTIQQLTTIRDELLAENRRLKGRPVTGRIGPMLVTALPNVPKAGISFPGAYKDSTYCINATVYPKEKIVLDGHRPDPNVMDETRGRGMHNVAPFTQTFKIGDTAVYHGYNFDYYGTIVSIGPKTITIEEYGDRKKRLTIARFAFWNRRDREFSIRERREWTD